jgi:cytochrome c biogenesis protein CcmG/thiol:disulfide interchange protein DsbE
MIKRTIARLRWLVPAAALLLTACGAGDAEDKGANSPADEPSHDLIGNRAPEISVVAMTGHGRSVSLKNLRGKVVVVDFWGTFCEPCKKSFPKLQELNAKYGDSGLEIVAISEDEAEDKDKIPSFADAYGAKFTIAWDSHKSAAKLYNLPTMPSSFVIDRRGRVRYAHAGYRDGEADKLERELKKLLKEN